MRMPAPNRSAGPGKSRNRATLPISRTVFFSKRDPGAIARSLKRSADRDVRRKSNPYRSAMPADT
ncbi:MAG TPA: DUF3175 domain-containing protein [Thermoanaerobaculia bacterium]|nr:DUF3175 domain-containing protein [Thermoanaerobaculia bacterium]